MPSPTAYELYRSGVDLLEQGDNHAAALPLARARDLEPTTAMVREALGRALFSSQRYREAAEEFAVLVELEPLNDYGQFCLGRALQLQGLHAQARPPLTLAALLQPARRDYAVYRDRTIAALAGDAAGAEAGDAAAVADGSRSAGVGEADALRSARSGVADESRPAGAEVADGSRSAGARVADESRPAGAGEADASRTDDAATVDGPTAARTEHGDPSPADRPQDALPSRRSGAGPWGAPAVDRGSDDTAEGRAAESDAMDDEAAGPGVE